LYRILSNLSSMEYNVLVLCCSRYRKLLLTIWIIVHIITMMAWDVKTTDEYDAWFLEQDLNERR